MNPDPNERDESDEKRSGRQDNYGRHIYARLLEGKKLLTSVQLDALVTALLEDFPHHGRLLDVMRHACLCLPVTLGLQIGDLDRRQAIFRISRGWSDHGSYDIPKREGRGFIQQGDLAPTVVSVSARGMTSVQNQIVFLNSKGYPTGPGDWLFPGRSSGHPWTPGSFTQTILQPVLAHLELPSATQKDLYFSILRERIEGKVSELSQPVAASASPLCSDPTCPRRLRHGAEFLDTTRLSPLTIPTPSLSDCPHNSQGECYENS